MATVLIFHLFFRMVITWDYYPRGLVEGVINTVVSQRDPEDHFPFATTDFQSYVTEIKVGR